MITYPQEYKMRSNATAGTQNKWSASSKFNSNLTCAIPPEFEGPGDGLSPEDFYGLALLNCFVATFKVFSEKSKLHFESMEAQGTLTVDRNEKGFPWMAKFHLDVQIHGAENPERTQALLEKTSKSCLVLNSVNTEKTFAFRISGKET